MIPAASVTGLPAKAGQPVAHHSAARTAHAHAPETARSSGGETAAAHVKLDTAKAVTAPDQTAVAPRLRDQETAERTERAPQAKDAPTGPPPSFEESPLERQARVVFDPPDAKPDPAFDIRADVKVTEDDGPPKEPDAQAQPPADPPPTPTERAEASFAETKTISTAKAPATVDVEL